MFNRKSICLILGCLLATLWMAPGLAQNDKAGVGGTVKDATGALVPDATIRVINMETGQVLFPTTTGPDGTYTVPSVLPPGNYQVEASLDGFKTATSEGFTLDVGDVKTVDMKLEVGDVTERVTVTGAPSALQTSSSDVGTVITGREIVDLPLNGQNFTELATIQPGVSRSYVGVLTDATAFNQGDNRIGGGPGGSNAQGSTEASRFSRSGGASISVNGVRPTQNDFMLDGVDNNENQYGTIGIFPNPEAIQEFKIDTSGAKAEYGRGGAVVNTLYKTGSNSFHGEAYYFGQNSALNASDWTLNSNPIHQTKSVAHINEFGGQVGGPVLLPGYDGKNHTFFFVDYLRQRNRFPNPFTTTVPTAKSRSGDFSEFLRTDPKTGKLLGQIIDPSSCPAVTGVPGAVDTSSPQCTTFNAENGSNVIPNLKSNAFFSPQGFALLNAYPLPTVKGITNPGNGPYNYFGQQNNQEQISSIDAKIDHQLSDKNRIAGRFSYDNQQRLRDNYFPGLPTAGFDAGQELGNTRGVAVSDTHIFRPTILNEAKFGYLSVDIGILNCGVEGACGVPVNFCVKLGIPNCNKGTAATSGGLLIGGFGNGFVQSLGDGGLFESHSKNFYVNDDVTIIRGKHTLKAGAEARRARLDVLDGGRAGDLKGQLQYGNPGPGDIGNIQADMLLSMPARLANSGTITGGDNPLQLRKIEWGMFVQDDWKFSNDLTLNVGMRYEIFPGFYEINGRQANFLPATSTLVVPKNKSDSLINTDMSNWGPRVGFAYTLGPEKKMVLRGSFGMFYAQDGLDFPPLGRNPPVISSVSFDNTTGGGITSNYNLTSGPPVAAVSSPPIITSSTALYTVPKNQIVANIQELNLGVQYQLAPQYLWTVGYVGSRSRHLLANEDLGSNMEGLGSALTPNGAHLGQDLVYDNRAYATYDSLQTSLRRNLSHGLLYLVSYTWSHGIDNSTGVFNSIGERGRPNPSLGSGPVPVDPFNWNLEKGNSSIDHRHIFVLSGVWELPFGKGKSYAGNVTGVVGRIISDWQLNFVQTAQSGQHFEVDADSKTSSGVTRADLTGSPYGGSVDQFLNVKAFQPAATHLTTLAGNTIAVGNLSRNFFTGPALFQTDLSLFKTTNITEKVKAQLQVDFFNAWNSVNRLVPDNNIGDGQFGQFVGNGVVYPPRRIQYALKVIF
jgi:hypothetical protein